MKRLYVICLAIICVSIQSFAAFSVTNMRVCDINSPIGMDRTPIFSWQVTSTERGFYQVAYQIVVTDESGTEVWNSGKVDSDLQSNIIYEGTPLQSRTRYNWTLTIYDGSGGASTPSSSSFETAFMNESEWTAKWINAEDTELLPSSSCEIDFRSPVSCRYLKIDVTKLGLPASTDAGYYYFQLSELEAYSGSTNVALGTVVTPSNNWNYSTIWNSTYLTDGKITNNALLGYTSQPFSSNSQHIYVTIDLGSIKTIDKVVLYPRQDVPSTTSSSSAANFPASFTVQSSSDNVTYTTQYQATNLPTPVFQVNAKRLPLFGYNFVVPNGKTIRRGRLYATALGIFTMHLNGQAVTENKLEPGETEFQKSILYSTYDVTDKLTNGDNTLIANVGGGLFNITALSGRYTKPEIFNSGPKCLKSELFIDYTDGSSDHFVTDASWKYTQSAVTGTNWWGGEDYDARREIAGLYDHYFDVSSWNTVKEVSPTFYTNTPNTTQNYTKLGTLKARFYEPLRVVETWQGVNVTLLSNGNYRLDFGRNYAGQYKFTLNGTSGQTITLRAGERLNSDGSCYRDSQYANIYDTYTFKGDSTGETWGPEFMYHGFRYLEISGLTKAPNASNFTAYRIRSNMENIGSMKTSNTLLNQIHTICRDAIQSNLYNTITDCPQREKLGWLEVPNMMYNSIVANYDMKTFYQKVVMDCFDAQYADGHVPSTSPHWMVVYDDDPNWGGTSILVPYKNYKLYGDKALMKTYYTRMKTLIDYYATKSSGYIMLGSSYSVLSDWGQNTAGLTNQVPGEFTITTTYYYMLNAMAEMATQLGNSADAQKYTALASKVKTAFNAKFYGQYNPGVYEYGNMAEYGMPLYYGLVDSANVATVASKLAGAVKSSNYKIKTGEIGLKPVLMSLAKYGYNDIVYKMANQTDYPSYGYFVMQGCTTTPEFWDMSQSQNHCMMDHIEEWFYSELGGIKNSGIGYKTIKIQPWIPTDMTQMDISTKSLYGKIRSSYQKAPKGGYVYTFEVPESSTATIVVPIINNMKLMEGIDEVSVGNGIQSVTYSDSLATVVVGSGSYTFSMGETGDTDTALEEVIWTPVHSTNQLTAGSVIKIQETAPCAQYNTYSKTWNSGRFIGYSTSYPIATGNFIRGAMKDFAANLVIDSPTSYSIDGKDTYCCNLKNPGTSLYVNSRNNSFTMLSWYTSPLLWGFDIADGNASFFKYGTTLTKTGNYVFFYDNGIQSSIFSNGASTNYAPIWNVYKQYNVIDSASVILAQGISGKDSIFYQRSMDQNGSYETIVLPFTVSEQELPKDYSFYRFSGSEITDHNTVKLYIRAVTSLIAGEAYMMQYSGNNPSLVHQQFEFRKVFETAVNNANIVSGTYKYLTPTDIVPGKTLFVLQPDGNAFIHAGASDHVSPFRACIITSSASAPDKYEIVVNQSGTDLQNPFADNNEKMDVYNILGQKVLLQATRDDIDQLKNGLYVTKYGKFIIHK